MNATGTNDTATILVVEDEEIIRTSLCEFLSDEGYEVAMAESVQAARTLVHTEPFLQMGFDVAICDVQLPDGDGIELLGELIQQHPNTVGLVITAYATVDNAVKAFGVGASDYLVKPVIFDDLAHKLKRLFHYRELNSDNRALRRELKRQEGSVQIIGSSEPLSRLLQTIHKVADTHSNVLLVGETGTGAELDPLNCSKANCSAADPLNPSPESSGKPDKAPSTSTKSPNCHSRHRLDSSEQSSTTKSCPSAGQILKPLKLVSSPRPAGTSPEKSMAAAFRKTCSIGSMESNCRFLRFENDSKMSPNWSSSLSRNTPRRWGNE
jgi:CheY-like chemotaxis protein